MMSTYYDYGGPSAGPHDPVWYPEGEEEERCCRECGCTDYDCSECIERTGSPCSWIEEDLCSACAEVKA